MFLVVWNIDTFRDDFCGTDIPGVCQCEEQHRHVKNNTENVNILHTPKILRSSRVFKKNSAVIANCRHRMPQIYMYIYLPYTVHP